MAARAAIAHSSGSVSIALECGSSFDSTPSKDRGLKPSAIAAHSATSNEPAPPYSTDAVIDFYEQTGFDAGVSVDHVIPIFDQTGECEDDGSPWKARYELTLELAEEFLDRHRARGCSFEPVGVAQGWDPKSYASAVTQLQKLGYQRIALGGLVPLKTPEILAVLEAVARVKKRRTELHLFGISRCENVPQFQLFGVTSFDSTSPFRQAFKDETDNYYVLNGAFTAIRVPQVEGNAKLAARIRSGEIKQDLARRLEQEALAALRQFDDSRLGVAEVVSKLKAYQELHDTSKDRSEQYAETLAAAPWRKCKCEVCKRVGIEVVLFRGTERNKRRGFHTCMSLQDA